MMNPGRMEYQEAEAADGGANEEISGHREPRVPHAPWFQCLGNRLQADFKKHLRDHLQNEFKEYLQYRLKQRLHIMCAPARYQCQSTCRWSVRQGPWDRARRFY